MKLAIWNTPAAEFLVSGLVAEPASPIEVVRDGARACVAMLERGDVDVALLPAITALKDNEEYDLLPAIALSSWSFPFARLILKNGLERPVQSVAFDPLYAGEAVLSRVILKEHYGFSPAFVPYPSPSVEQLLEAKEDASLVIGNEVAQLRTEHLALDLGQEWYELSNYPMVWGLFATLKGRARPDIVRAMRGVAEKTEAYRAVWIQAQEMSPVMHEFFAEDLRVRLDDLAVAGLTEFAQQLFYANVLDEVADLPFASLPEDDEEDASPEPLA